MVKMVDLSIFAVFAWLGPLGEFADGMHSMPVLAGTLYCSVNSKPPIAEKVWQQEIGEGIY